MTETELLDIARQFRINTVAPQAGNWERDRIQPVAVLREAGKLGLLSFETPTALGGLGASFQLKQAVCEELSRGDMAFTFAMINTQNISAKLALSEQPKRYTSLIAGLMQGELFGATALSEPGAGSDFSGISTRADKTRDGWLLNGTKGWITRL